ncbi:TPA: hypothetical protein NJ546_004597 [Vibrio parahaemolyticus]|uniref:hypothetical protein n=1 Tax=Vibrio TaxID=662 RepID=UPI00111D6FF0|nr:MULTISPECIES: hypothetical protein [Vibrio]MCA2483275.1 hypothetical protein [Vibrio alginolyticus]MDW1617009.1 hypothetical protein [Vibrio sp. Vb2881]MDW1621721.1 hypothetical protein [Vibrio sp. Vb2864]MDW1693857.1 hypothetical protein [Vibrio sp. Vb2853]MDW1712593.1 hypothetical protein [Vibrio sp. Vb2865]
MENYMLSVAIGIISSLLATGLFIGLSEFVRRVVLPWYEDKIYRGVRVDGAWSLIKISDINFEDEDMKMHLTQHGDRISGSYYHVDDGKKDEYVVSGRISGMYFLATAVPKTSRQIDAISFLLHIDTNQGHLQMSGGVLNQGKPGEVKVHDGCVFKWDG